jgi:restriction system protein
MATKDEVRAKLPTYAQLMFPTLKALKALGGSATNEEILDKVVELENFSEAVQKAQRDEHRQTILSYRLHWARSYLKAAGAVANNERGVWTLTEKGASLTEEDCKTIPAETRKKNYEIRKQKKHKPEKSPDDEAVEVDEETSWRDRLLAVLTKMKPDAFERLAQRVLREAGFTKVDVKGKSGDGGIDGIGILRVNLVSFVVLFQCKRYQGSVGSSVIRDFRGAMMGRCDKGLVITTGNFSSDARKEATRDGAPTIDLIDGEALCDLLKSLKLGVTVATVEEVSVQSDWFSQI